MRLQAPLLLLALLALGQHAAGFYLPGECRPCLGLGTGALLASTHNWTACPPPLLPCPPPHAPRRPIRAQAWPLGTLQRQARGAGGRLPVIMRAGGVIGLPAQLWAHEGGAGHANWPAGRAALGHAF